MTNIFIANLDWDITSDDLMATFSSFGKVTYAHVVFDKATKKSKGFGYIEMEDTDAAINAIQALNGMEINDRKLDVKIASPKGNRPLVRSDKPKKEFEKKPFKPGDKPAFNKDRGPKRDFQRPTGDRPAARPYNPEERKPFKKRED